MKAPDGMSMARPTSSAVVDAGASMPEGRDVIDRRAVDHARLHTQAGHRDGPRLPAGEGLGIEDEERLASSMMSRGGSGTKQTRSRGAEFSDHTSAPGRSQTRASSRRS
jgi:hypothetical protein